MRKESVQELFSQIAKRFPTDLAIQRLETGITYTELDQKSNRLANFLVASKATKGAMVAILAEDSLTNIISIIGTLKAGCIFVPLDPKIPERRLQAMLAQVAPEWMVIEPKFFGKLSAIEVKQPWKIKLLCLDKVEIEETVPQGFVLVKDYQDYHDPARCLIESAPDDMSYVYFTSGSTGIPKGIVGRLKGIDHFIKWEIKTFGVERGTRVSQLTTPSFDAFLRDVFTPLCAGGTVCVPPEREMILEPGQLIDWLDRQRINLIHCVPSLFRSIINHKPDPQYFGSLKYILLSGEHLLPADVRRWMEIYGDRVQLVNLYGPTETTMTKFFYFVKAADRDRGFIPVGKPMEGARAILVNERKMVCPPGTVGEIYIRTPFRTHGYLNQPELTKESFVQNPFSHDPNDLVYKTGDLGRILDDGDFELLGRRDQQVKIRGVRVEPGEIENLLREHEAVSDVVVVDREDVSGNKYLCAYVVLDGELDPGVLKEHLAQNVPAHTMPSAFVRMEALPRTLSGKVERRSLPTPGEALSGTEKEHRAPRTPIEEVLASIWSEVLNSPRVGIDDNFFEMGGHSLLATQIMSRIRETLLIELPLQRLFKEPTIAALARSIEAARQDDEEPLPPLRPVERDRALPLSFGQQRLWFLDQLEHGSVFYNVPAAVRLTGRLDLAALERTFDEVIRRHEVLRTSFRTIGDKPVQVVAPEQKLTPLCVDISSLPEAQRESEVQLFARAEAQRPFDLSSGPLLRVSLVRVSEDEHVVVFVMHHIISDGWSMGVLVRELGRLYNAYVKGEESPLAELPIQYADYAVWQREWLQGRALARQLDYWRRQLHGAEALELPTDRPRPVAQTFKGSRQYVSLSESLTADLKALSRHEGASLFMTLLAAFKIALHYHTGKVDILVGSPVANRNRVELEGLIGFFINNLVLRTDLAGDPSFRELLRRVRDVALEAYAHQDIPFEKLVGELKLERNLASNPLYEVAFVLDQVLLPTLELADLTLSPVALDTGAAQFDVVLHLTDIERQIIGSLQYRTDLFDAATMERFFKRFEIILQLIVAGPDARLSDLKENLAAEERRLWRDKEREMEQVTLQKLKNVRRQTVSALRVE